MEGSGHQSSLRVILLRRTAYTATSTSSWSQGCFLTRCCLVPRKHVLPRTLMNNSPPLPLHLTLLSKKEEKGLAFRHEIQILARIREMAKRQSGTSFAAVLSAKLKTQVYTHTRGGHYRKKRNSLARGGTFEYVALDLLLLLEKRGRNAYQRVFQLEYRAREFLTLFLPFFFFLPKISRLSFLRCFVEQRLSFFCVVRRFSWESKFI